MAFSHFLHDKFVSCSKCHILPDSIGNIAGQSIFFKWPAWRKKASLPFSLLRMLRKFDFWYNNNRNLRTAEFKIKVKRASYNLWRRGRPDKFEGIDPISIFPDRSLQNLWTSRNTLLFWSKHLVQQNYVNYMDMNIHIHSCDVNRKLVCWYTSIKIIWAKISAGWTIIMWG